MQRLIENARRLRRDMTDAERCLWRRLREQRLRNYKFRRQQPIGRYIVDFVCLQKNLVIELDGGQHVESKEVDAERTQWFESQGFRVLRFWNDDVLCKTDTVMHAIWSALQTGIGLTLPPSSDDET